ncbi:hypothetical protein AMS58_14340 [Pseudoalteromonas porphyrae]|uniref:glycosyl hydrolase family 18 protein n=1 Tax=Pseudoalteromonas TaxID=53246 RepID=UPI0006BABFBC|nr:MULTISPECIES: glycosyl hydrolase family 18 protein [Pseudoalteromonas]KPH93951.1 hypothetical protein AMS58_14340 [Pseudoalteromonas porphyrae]NNG44951.1 hypothetical protein [Pseudoalteromonas sp. NEC-BIFX-2020_002]
MSNNKALMVGYLQSWSNITFTQAAEQGYTAIVMAFGKIDGATVGIFGDAFAASPSETALKADIKKAKSKGAQQVLFSVGGEINTYNPNDVSTVVLAQNLVEYLTDYGFTGVDFDLEINGDGKYLDELCQAIKQLAPTLLITAAPQVNQFAPGSDLYLVSTGHCRMYDQAINNNRFDYLFIQAYNNPFPDIDGSKETNVDFISKSFINFKKSIPAETLIVIGEPANRDAAGTSIFTVPDVPANIYPLISDQYQAICKDPQFGGAMVWSINLDAQTNYQFVKAVKDTI